MYRAMIPIALMCGLFASGCESSATKQDYTKKPSPGDQKPYIPANHQNKFEPVNKGPTQPNPRQKSQPN